MSREHVVPKCAGNAGRVIAQSLDALARGKKHGEVFQNGMIRSTLCAWCNSKFGRHYVPAFSRWTRQALVYRERIAATTCLLLPFSVVPLLVVKQIAVMTLAMSHRQSIDAPHFFDLRRFVFHPEARAGRMAFRFYTYFHFGPPTLQGLFTAVATDGGPSPTIHCHVGIEPLGYVVTADDDHSLLWANRAGLCDLTRFAYREHDLVAVEHLHVPCLRGNLLTMAG